MLEVRLLGQFDVRRDSAKPISIPSRPAQSLLAFLLINPYIEHRREKLAGILWPDATEKNARSNLRHALWQVRDAIEPKRTRARAAPYLLVNDISISFNAQAKYWLDVSVVQAANRENASVDDLIGAVRLYAGELLPGFYDDWVLPERERLRSVFEQRMKRLLEQLQDEQRWKKVLEEAERWIALAQSPEAAYRALMIAHSQLGEMSQVAAVYQRCMQALRDDLGVEPSEQARLLFEQLKSGKAEARSPSQANQPAGEQAAAQLRLAHTNLPIQLTSFIGREHEIAQVKRLLATHAC
jgi:DNA-binding SARP family transcriptional activator